MNQLTSRWCDHFEAWWISRSLRTARSMILTVTLLGGILLIELNRRDLLPGVNGEFPRVHLVAIAWTVTVLLLFEIVQIILSLGRSVADSVGQHLQLYALVLLRDAFAELSHLQEPISVSPEQFHTVFVMAADAGGAIVLFALSVLFRAIQRHRPIVQDAMLSIQFVGVKKTISLLLLAVLAALILRDLVSLAWDVDTHELVDVFFTVLVFVDVLLAVISIAYADNPTIIFRNFGFAFAAILLRLAIASPEFVRPSLGVVGGVVAIAITLVYNASRAERFEANPAVMTDEPAAETLRRPTKLATTESE